MTEDPPRDHLTPQYLQVAIERLFTAASRALPEWTEVLWVAQFDGDGWPMLNVAHNGDQRLRIPFWLASDDLTILEEAVARCRRALQVNRLEPWQVVVASVTSDGSFQWKTFYDDDPRLAELEMMPDSMPQAEAWARAVLADDAAPSPVSPRDAAPSSVAPDEHDTARGPAAVAATRKDDAPLLEDLTGEHLHALITRLYGSATHNADQEWTDLLFMARFDGDGWPVIQAFHNGDQPVQGAGWTDGRDDMLIVTEALVRCRRALEANDLEPWQTVVISITHEGAYRWKTFQHGDPRVAGLEFMPDTMPAVVDWGRRIIAED